MRMNLGQKACLGLALSFSGVEAQTNLEMVEASSLSQESYGRDRVSYNQWLATSIDVGESEEAFRVSSVTLRARVLYPNANVYVALYGTEGLRPSAAETFVLFDASSLAYAPSSPDSADFQLSPVEGSTGTEAVLQPGQRYWLVLGVSDHDYDQDVSTGLYEWDYIESGKQISQDGNLIQIADTIAAGGTGGQNWEPVSASPQSFGIQLSPVPEPGVTSLLLCVLLGGLSVRRR
ncbi:choice-of-anchor R domain-containing protein [Roseibacillus persicicus]